MKYLLVADFGDCQLSFECDCVIQLMLAIDFFVDCFSFAKEIYFKEFNEDNDIVDSKRILKKED